MARNFNIRNRDWDLSYSYHLAYSNILIEVANFLELKLFSSIYQVLILQSMPPVYSMTRVKGNDNMISCATTISVSTSCSRCYVLASTSCIMTWLHYILQTLFLWAFIIYRVDTVLYLYALPIVSTLIPFSSLCLSFNLSQA